MLRVFQPGYAAPYAPDSEGADMEPELRVLLLEDMAPNAKLIQDELSRSGLRFCSTRVETRDQFLEEIAQYRPDVILSDHGLPSFDGLVALEEARRRFPELPFIFVTGTRGEEEAVRAIQHGADDHILKDHLERLGPAVTEALRRCGRNLGSSRGRTARNCKASARIAEPLNLKPT
jgi:CheY-like chemotaxis protein